MVVIGTHTSLYELFAIHSYLHQPTVPPQATRTPLFGAALAFPLPWIVPLFLPLLLNLQRWYWFAMAPCLCVQFPKVDTLRIVVSFALLHFLLPDLGFEKTAEMTDYLFLHSSQQESNYITF
jgi:hypothetical protein